MRPARRLIVLALLALGVLAQPATPAPQPLAEPTPPPAYYPSLSLRVPAALTAGQRGVMTLSYNHGHGGPITLALTLPAGLSAYAVSPSPPSPCTLAPVACEVSLADGMSATITVSVEAAADLCGGWAEVRASAAIGGVVVAESEALVQLLAPACTTPTPEPPPTVYWFPLVLS